MELYAIQAVTGGPIKVGCSEDVLSRVYSLQCGNPETLVIIGRAPIAGQADEARAHRALSGYRYKREWFKDHEIVLKFVSLLAHGFNVAIERIEQANLRTAQLRRTLDLDRSVRRLRRKVRRCIDQREIGTAREYAYVLALAREQRSRVASESHRDAVDLYRRVASRARAVAA